MAKSRDASVITANDLPGAVMQLNFILARMQDRLDKLEGLRDDFESQSSGSFDGAVSAESVSVSNEDTELHALGGE